MEKWRKITLFIGDGLSLCIAGYLMLISRFGLKQAPNEIPLHLKPFIIWGILVFLIFYIFNLYETSALKPTLGNIRQFIFAIIVSAITGIMLFYLFPFSIAPKTNLLITQLYFTFLILFWRRSFYRLFSKRFKNNIAFIGETPESKILIKNIIDNPPIGYEYQGTFESFEMLKKSNLKINTVVYASGNNTIDLIELSKSNYIHLDISKAFQIILSKIPVSLMNDTLALNIIENRRNFLYNSMKRFIDILFSSLLLVTTLPITLLAMLARYLEDGRPFFIRQKRIGKTGRIFTLYKLRSMQALAPDGSAEIAGVQWASENDPRITPVGKIIRKLHIDEIPQMFNILRGDITIVGPRPERPEFVSMLEKEIPYYFLRHTIKPGFTGWAQIKYRYARTIEDSKEKFEYDLYYIKNRNFFLDMGIIVRTVQIIFTH
ncbi:MAG: exopolysaccharide biosynthesis polyprenyl glycosylphosphotransferase [Patescibacteria group bacterium]